MPQTRGILNALAAKRCGRLAAPYRRVAASKNDVDLHWRAGAEGFRVACTPFAMLVHYKSSFRGSDEMGENRARV